MAKRYGYNQEKCDALKRDRKNLTNKLYRRRQKMKSSPDGPGKKKIQRDIEKIKTKVDALNSRIWKCSKQYYNLKSEERSVKRKISYREKKLKGLKKGTKQSSKTKAELKELKHSSKKYASKLFKGSDKYQNLRVNLKRLQGMQKYRQKKLANNTIVDKSTKKEREMTSSERIELSKEIISYQGEIDKIKVLLDIPVIEYEVPDFKSLKFQMDEDDETEIYGRPIFLWENQWSNLLQRNIYTTAIIQGQEFTIPAERISMDNAINEAVAKYSSYGSAVNVVMTANNETQTMTLDFEIIEL